MDGRVSKAAGSRPPRAKSSKIDRWHQTLLEAATVESVDEGEGEEFRQDEREKSAALSGLLSFWPTGSRLTRENLATLDKITRRGAGQGSMSSLSQLTTETESAPSSITSNPVVRAERNGILCSAYSKPPTNLANIRKQHARSRETASPPQSRFRAYCRKARGHRTRETMIFEMSRQMLREYDGDLGYRKNLMRAFTHFPRHIGLNNRLPAPQPDFIEGLEVRAFGPFLRADDINGAMRYEDDAFSVTLPHLAGEWERDEGGMDKAIQQSAYVGAALVYARNQALSLIGNPDPPGHAVVRTFATNGNHIIFFAHFAAPSEKTGTTEYHQYRYASVDILDDY